jgi:hypothetical protein
MQVRLGTSGPARSSATPYIELFDSSGWFDRAEQLYGGLPDTARKSKTAAPLAPVRIPFADVVNNATVTSSSNLCIAVDFFPQNGSAKRAAE